VVFVVVFFDDGVTLVVVFAAPVGLEVFFATEVSLLAGGFVVFVGADCALVMPANNIKATAAIMYFFIIVFFD